MNGLIAESTRSERRSAPSAGQPRSDRARVVLEAFSRLDGASPVAPRSPARVFAAQLQAADELEFIPAFAVAFSGCNLRCAFCNESDGSWNPGAGSVFDAEVLAAAAREALAQGARCVMITGGEATLYPREMVGFIAALPDSARVVLKTNAVCAAETRTCLAGLVDTWLADFKFGNDECAKRLAGAAGYVESVIDTILWADQRSELIVRHVLLPGHVDCCWSPIAAWLAARLPRVKTSLRSGFWPMAKSWTHAELRRPVSEAEARRARQIAAALNLRLIP